MKKRRLKIINSVKEHKRALAAIEQLWESKPGTEEHDALEVLALLVEDYEKRLFLMPEPDPVAAIRAALLVDYRFGFRYPKAKRDLNCMVEAPQERCWQWLLVTLPGGMTLQGNLIERAMGAARFLVSLSSPTLCPSGAAWSTNASLPRRTILAS